MIVPLAASGIGQCIVYTLLFLRAQSWPPVHLAVTLVTLLLGPLLVGLILTAVRRSRFPLTTALVATFIVFNFEVVILAALRLQVSYSSLLAAAIVALLGSVFANIRLHRGLSDRVAILSFAKDAEVARLIGGKSDIIADADADIAAYDIVLIDGATHHVSKWSTLLTRAHMQGAEIIPWISYLEQRRGQVDIDSFDLSHFAYTPSQIYFARIKRGFDLALLFATLPLTIPMGAAIWLYIKIIDQGRSAFFVQTRRGYGGKNFRMFKFRTMYAGTHGGATEAMDKRVMPGCRFLRRTRLDELPQLINIWRGQMSWVGPRPESMELARRYEAEIPQYAYRLLVLPGITGWAQVNVGYTSTASEARIKLAYDLYYLKNISLDLELEILARTIRTLLTRAGAR